MLIEVQEKEKKISDIDSNDDEKLLGFVLLKRMSNAARQCFVRVPKRFIVGIESILVSKNPGTLVPTL